MEELAIRPLAGHAEAEACARMMAETDPWITLGRGHAACLELMLDESRERYVAWRGERLAGLLVLNLHGAFVGYVQSVCVAPEFRGTGLGTALVAFAEERIFRDHPNVFLCVSSFNPAARRLYERLGYRLVGELADFLMPGHSELLFRKPRAAPARFVPLHVERTGVLRLQLPFARALALLTPEGERQWVKGWVPEYLHPQEPAPFPVPGTAFRTFHGGEETLWLVLAFDAARGASDYLRFTPASRIGTVSVRVRAAGENATEADVTYRTTALSTAGNRVLQELTADRYAAMLREWEVSIRAR
jgi:[ribosomal protein S18]-alanine N-acetyltransferase